jgi:hypothetical protein
MNRNAEDENAMAPCSNATLEGRFLFTEAGFEPNEGKLVPFAISGYQDNANGAADGVATYIVNGEFNPPEPYRGTYTVNADCTGTSTFTDGTQFNLVTTPDGRMHTYRPNPPGLWCRGLHYESETEPLITGEAATPRPRIAGEGMPISSGIMRQNSE